MLWPAHAGGTRDGSQGPNCKKKTQVLAALLSMVTTLHTWLAVDHIYRSQGSLFFISIIWRRRPHLSFPRQLSSEHSLKPPHLLTKRAPEQADGLAGRTTAARQQPLLVCQPQLAVQNGRPVMILDLFYGLHCYGIYRYGPI